MRISDWSSDVCSSDLDMRLPEIAEPPGRGRDNGECAGASEQAEHVRIDVAKNVADARALAEIGERDDGQGDERYHPDRALDENGQADCKEAAEHDIGDGDRGRDPQTGKRTRRAGGR